MDPDLLAKRATDARKILSRPAHSVSAELGEALVAVRALGLDEAAADVERATLAARRLADMISALPDLPATPDLVALHWLSSRRAAARQRHDLKTPLSAIIGYSGLVLEDVAEAAGAEALSVLLRRASDTAVALTEAIDRTLVHDELADVETDETGPVPPPFPRVEEMVEADPAMPSAPGWRALVLVVDDDLDSRALVRRRLAQQGHDVVQASSGAEALGLLAGSAFDLVMLDLVMPTIDGFEVLREIKADATLRHVPVIVLSGQNEIESAIRCIEAGAEDYLSKPFNPVLLRARVGASLERKRARDREREQAARIVEEKARADTLLRAILPEPIVERLQAGEKVIADRFGAVSVLFCDIVGFTAFSARTPPTQVVEALDRLFSAFDALSRECGVEKIKTIGDCYMAAAGLPGPRADHAEAITRLGLGMVRAVTRLRDEDDLDFEVRVGIHSGPVVAGVIGRDKFIYDVWGDTVNVASRIEEAGVPGRVQVSQATRDLLGETVAFEPARMVNLDGIGLTQAFLLARD